MIFIPALDMGVLELDWPLVEAGGVWLAVEPAADKVARVADRATKTCGDAQRKHSVQTRKKIKNTFKRCCVFLDVVARGYKNYEIYLSKQCKNNNIYMKR